MRVVLPNRHVARRSINVDIISEGIVHIQYVEKIRSRFAADPPVFIDNTEGICIHVSEIPALINLLVPFMSMLEIDALQLRDYTALCVNPQKAVLYG
jgi:hypothetical protein